MPERQEQDLYARIRSLPLPDANTPPDEAERLTIAALSAIGEVHLGLPPEPGVPSILDNTASNQENPNKPPSPDVDLGYNPHL